MAKHKHAEAIKAWADGAEIEYFSEVDKIWKPTTQPAWLEGSEYRIKPEPKPDREYIQYYLEYGDEGVWNGCSSEKNQRVKWTIDGETGRIKSIELLDK